MVVGRLHRAQTSRTRETSKRPESGKREIQLAWMDNSINYNKLLRPGRRRRSFPCTGKCHSRSRKRVPTPLPHAALLQVVRLFVDGITSKVGSANRSHSSRAFPDPFGRSPVHFRKRQKGN